MINLLTDAQFWITILIALLSFQLGRSIGQQERTKQIEKIISVLSLLGKPKLDKDDVTDDSKN